eukprot:9664516-Karenia_brevis.AAC.1
MSHRRVMTQSVTPSFHEVSPAIPLTIKWLCFWAHMTMSSNEFVAWISCIWCTMVYCVMRFAHIQRSRLDDFMLHMREVALMGIASL